MGTILASEMIGRLRLTLLDPTPGVTWLDADLLAMLNEGQRNACELRPELYQVRAPIELVAGTLQTIPADGTVFVRLDENVAGGLRCRLVDSALLDTAARFWPAATPEVAVQEYCADAKDRKRFHVLPPNDGTGEVIALYCAVPPAIEATDDPITLDDIYELPLKHFVLSEAYAANTKRQDLAKASFYRQSFEKMLGINATASVALQPKYGTTPGGA